MTAITNYRILLIDDDTKFHQKMRSIFGKDYEFDGAIDEKKATEKLNTNQYDLIWLDLDLAYGDFRKGLENIKPFSELAKGTPVIVVSNDSRTSTVVDAIKEGATDYLCKGDFDIDYWDDRFRKHIEDAKQRQKQAKLTQMVRIVPPKHEKNTPLDAFIGNSSQITELKKTLQVLSQNYQISVLLMGETGVGKEVAAHYLHACSLRKDKPFVAINLSAIPRELMESTLFGHKKASFTGAEKDQIGLFQEANTGVLFLDEIGDIEQQIQVKLLRFLEDKIIRPVGGKEIQLDVQVIAATNVNLKVSVEDGRFRKDLYERLNGFIVTIPTLRERKEDIEPLCQFFTQQKLNNIAEQSVIDRFYQYNWSGNVRELRNTLESMQIKALILNKDKASIDCLPEELRELKSYTIPQITEQIQNKPKDNTGNAQMIKHLDFVENELKNNSSKSHIAQQMGKTADDLLYLIKKKYYPKNMQLFTNYPRICNAYNLK